MKIEGKPMPLINIFLAVACSYLVLGCTDSRSPGEQALVETRRAYDQVREGRSSAIVELGDHLTSEDRMVRVNACAYLGLLSDVEHLDEASVERVVMLLEKALGHEDQHTRKAAAEGLLRWGARAEPALSSLQRLARQGDSHDGWFAVQAISKIGPDAHEAIPTLVGIVQDDDLGSPEHRPHIRIYAAEAIGDVAKEQDQAAALKLQEIVNETEGEFRAAVAFALEKLDPESSGGQQMLVDMAGSGSASERYARTLLGRLLCERGKEKGSALN